MTKAVKAKPKNLEEALQELEGIVQKLEESETPLEESIALFEKGTELSRHCYIQLQEAEKKVQVLVKKVPEPGSAEDFEIEELDDHEDSQ